MTMRRVTSSAIHSIGHDPETETTGVRFHSGPKVYEFPDMTAADHAAFANAESLGKHYHAHVKSHGVPRAA
jgi:KTSC domain